MELSVREQIKKDFQIKKFCVYGFLKDLKFFEPYLLIFLMSKGLTLLQIGFLITIREIIINVFELPSGFIADYLGRKKELYFCFGFYIISFIFFFMTNSFVIASFAMIFFGLGEAFRSGTHKAMIYTYLDSKNWQKEKTFVYGRTRAFSLIGSAISSILSIILILTVPSVSYIFAFSIIPYFIDLLLIVSYPKFLDKADNQQKTSLKMMFKRFFSEFKNSKLLKKLIINEGVTESTISYAKDMIQPILKLIIVGSGLVLFNGLSSDDNLNIILGLVYAIFNLFGSFASKKSYLLKANKTNQRCLFIINFIFTILFGILIFCTKYSVVVCIIYLFIYILQSVRKPIYIDELDNQIDKSTRATMLSVSSQIKSIMLMILAPFLGYLADTFGMGFSMLAVFILYAVTIPLFSQKSKQNNE